MAASENESVPENLESPPSPPPPPLESPSPPTPASPRVSEAPPTPNTGIASNSNINVGGLGISSSANANTVFKFENHVVGNPSVITPYLILRVSESSIPTLNVREGTFEDRSMTPNVELAQTQTSPPSSPPQQSSSHLSPQPSPRRPYHLPDLNAPAPAPIALDPIEPVYRVADLNLAIPSPEEEEE